MNQILFSKYNNNLNKDIAIKSEKTNANKSNYAKIVFVSIFVFSLCICIGVIIYLLYSAYSEYKRENLYESSFNNDYNISRLYTNTSTSSPNAENPSPIFTIIGIIKIDKIKISYPILSNIDDNLLKIGPCRFSGPYIANTVGNLCIAAHNYNDSRFFSNLSKLNINDEIQIFDNNGRVMIYKIFDKYETVTGDTSCTIPLGSNTIEITLITCNNFTGNRIIVKAKSITT